MAGDMRPQRRSQEEVSTLSSILPELLSLLSDTNEAHNFMFACALWGLASDASHVAAIVGAGAVCHLVPLLVEPEAQGYAAAALAQLTTHDTAARTHILELGGG